ncbi:protein-glutamate methylesterase/protein-glutamine glutaminase [Caminicella sporogenes]|uniref:protein-glutamate methylesterase/protein-glutamine glutaminase n=1 Tax=Caminicella sporogenes TaxID=166485 RepID=UPI00254141E9|nr:chemotaxis response regulator protein-glutamate methylesterase [Caminicella sporogenes]WIF94658.1 chemotaxis response regulator protein-glutamate methylesterase [Caminicella sporogenes]
MAKIRVLVVDDSAFMRKVLSDIISTNENIEVVGTARNGKEAIEKIADLKPDVVTLDVEMPVMDGLMALKQIMRKNPVPVLMLSSLTKEGADATIKALQYGAVDFIPKPSSIFKINADDVKNQLIEKILVASKVNLTKHTVIHSKIFTSRKKDIKSVSNLNIKTNNFKKIVAIGTSTGGPRALQAVLPNIPKDIDASFLIVQHMPPGFTKSLADRLNSISEINVKEAEDNDVLLAGHAYIAPGDYHMKLIREGMSYKIKLSKEPPVSGHRPSVDYMIDSIAKLNISNVIGVILTGMGSDGANGLKNLKDNNGFIIAQDEETCVVFGMPKAAIKLGIVDVVAPIDKISEEIIKAMEV